MRRSRGCGRRLTRRGSGSAGLSCGLRSWSAVWGWIALIRGRLPHGSGSGRKRRGGRGSSRSGSADGTASGVVSPVTRGKACGGIRSRTRGRTRSRPRNAAAAASGWTGRIPRQVKDGIIARRGKEAKNIAKVAAARELLTLAFYGMRDGHARRALQRGQAA